MAFPVLEEFASGTTFYAAAPGVADGWTTQFVPAAAAGYADPAASAAAVYHPTYVQHPGLAQVIF